MLRSAGDRDVAPVRKRRKLQRVLQALLCRHVARNHRQRANIQLRRIHRQQDRDGIVGSRVRVNDYLASGSRRSLRWKCEENQENDNRCSEEQQTRSSCIERYVGKLPGARLRGRTNTSDKSQKCRAEFLIHSSGKPTMGTEFRAYAIAPCLVVSR